MHWQTQLAQAISTIDELLIEVGLDPKNFSVLNYETKFPIRAPRPYVQRIKRQDPTDPLLLQILAKQVEQITVPGFSHDPLGEKLKNPIAGLLHKYQGRVLIITTAACAIHCRYCFRQHFDYAENNLTPARWQLIKNYIENDVGIEEVILSGGDPLTLSDKKLAWLINDIENIAHIKRLRFHSRLPVVLPDRINDDFLNFAIQSRLKMIMVLHANHAQELNDEVAQACAKLKSAGFTLLNQSVLLNDINNDVNSLYELSERLFEIDVLPYYLHLPDKVQGTSHFDVDINDAKKLVQILATRLPGYLVPKLVYEKSGEGSKTLVED